VPPPEVVVGRKPDASSKQSYSQNGRDVETECGV